MKSITLKNIPEGLHRTYRDRARRNARSLNREILLTLEVAAEESFPDRDPVLARVRKRVARQAERRRASGAKPLTNAAFLKAIQEGRE